MSYKNAIDSDTEDESTENTHKEEIAGIATIEPMTWKQIEQTSDVERWKRALEDEFLAQIKNDTWEIVSRPPNRKVIGSRFVFSTKTTGKKYDLLLKDALNGQGRISTRHFLQSLEHRL